MTRGNEYHNNRVGINKMLVKILSDNPLIWYDLKKVKALLFDFYPEDKLLRNLLFTCAVEMIPQRLIEKEDINQIELHTFEKMIIESHGCSREMACEVLGMLINIVRYSESICNVSDDRKKDVWLIPEKYKTILFGNISYSEPSNWEKEEKILSQFGYEIQYHCNSDDSYATFAILKFDNNNRNLPKDIIAYTINNFNPDRTRIILEEDITIKKKNGKKCIYSFIDEIGVAKLITYYFIHNQVLYIFLFTDLYGIRNEMNSFIDAFLNNIVWKRK